MRDSSFSTALCLLIISLLGLTQVNAWSGSKGTPHTREYFYIGGNYITAADATHFWENQMYVEELTPVGGSTKPYPLVFIHGLGQTGTNFLNTPDGRPGWSSYFLARGYTIYIVDTPARARSPWFSFTNQTIVPFAAEVIQQRFTAPEKFNTYPSAHLHTQWPGNGTIGDPIFDAFFESNVASILVAATSETLVQQAGAALLDRIGKKVILIGHSDGGKAPWLIADSRPKLVQSIVAIEPAGPPFIEPPLNGLVPARAWGVVSIPITYDPPVTEPSQIKTTVIVSNSTDINNCTIQDASKGKPRVLKNLATIDRVLILTSQASWHTGYDWCTTLFLKQAGVNAEQIKLQDVGVKGNGHMMFMEKNSDDVAEVLRGWIEGSKH